MEGTPIVRKPTGDEKSINTKTQVSLNLLSDICLLTVMQKGPTFDGLWWIHTQGKLKLDSVGVRGPLQCKRVAPNLFSPHGTPVWLSLGVRLISKMLCVILKERFLLLGIQPFLVIVLTLANCKERILEDCKEI